MENYNSRFRSTDQLPDHQVNEETFRQLHNIWKYICTHFMIWTSRNMKYELLRFLSFLNYPGSSQQDIRKLAIAGFYYFGDDDAVVCYCCGLWKRNWSPADVPLDIHQMLASSCDFHHRNREVNISFFTTADGGFRSINEITILVNNRRMGPMIVRPAEYIQANLLDLANVRFHDEISLSDYGRYDNGLLPTANLLTTQAVNVNNEHGIANHENHVIWGNVVPHDAHRMYSSQTLCIWGTELDTNFSQTEQMKMTQMEASCHPENLQSVVESEKKCTYTDERAQSLTNVKVYKDYDELAGLPQRNFPSNDVAKMKHNTGNIPVKTGLKSDERNPKQYAFTEESSSKENQHNRKKEQPTVDTACQIQPQTKAVNTRNERGSETECGNTIYYQFSVRYNRADTHNNKHTRESTYSVSTNGLRTASTAPADINQTHMYFPTTEDDHLDKPDKKNQSISDRNGYFESEFGNTQIDAGYCGGKAEMITNDKKTSAKRKQSANMVGKIPTNTKNVSSKGTRVRAFRNNSVCISNQLANGGFTAYSAHAGFVQCGTCNIEFEASDLQQDMWIKHAKASKNCRFVLQKKGHDFVQAVHEGQEEILQMYRDIFAIQEKK